MRYFFIFLSGVSIAIFAWKESNSNFILGAILFALIAIFLTLDNISIKLKK
ncbi:MAG: hypothetical protein HFJ40_03450 [Clostridia bacterium]|nr:hypothetical protein [Clostridia bacterium]